MGVIQKVASLGAGLALAGGLNLLAVGQQFVTDGLVGYWSMDAVVGGSSVEDAVGGHHGTIVDGALAIAQGKIGNALQFDGSGVHIRVADPEAFVANADFTWCAWINTSNPGGGILAKTSPDPGSDVQGAKTLFLDGGLLVFDVGWVGAVEGVTPVADGRWHYVSVTVTLGGAADTIQFYVDGALDAQGQLNVDQFPEEGFPIHIGLDPRVPGEPISVPFTGLIDEVAIYDRALSENEIANNAASTAGPALAVGPQGKLATVWARWKAY